MNEPQLIQRPSLVALLVAAGVPTKAISCPDFMYSLPSVEWLTGEFTDWCISSMAKLDLTYEEDGWDCENMGEWVSMWAKGAHRRTKSQKTSLAVGWLDYAVLGGEWPEGHNITIAVLRETPDRLRFFDLQLRMEEIHPTPQELLLCTDMRM